jgi:hypothetical protein
MTDISELVPYARHIHPAELAAGDLLFDTGGALRAIAESTLLRDGKLVSALLDDGHRVWLWNAEPMIAILPRETPPSLTFHERVFDPSDTAGWANGDPRVIDADTDTVMWDPDDGNPISWAVDQLGRRGTLEPSASPPFTERTWFSHAGVDFARSGPTLDSSAHLSEFTLAAAEQIGARITAPHVRRLDRAAGVAVWRAPASASRSPEGRSLAR